MKKLFFILFVACATLASCGNKWQEYSYDAPYNFKASFVKTPQIHVDTLAYSDAESMVVYRWENHFSDTDSHENSSYYVWITELPADVISSDSSDVAVEQLFSNFAGEDVTYIELLSSNVEELNGYRGKAFRWRNTWKNIYWEERFYLVGNMLFKVGVIANEGDYPNQSMSRFFNSFVLTGEAGDFTSFVETGDATYSIDFPATPEVIQRTVNTEIGNIVSNIAMLEEKLDDSGSVAYSVTEAFYGHEVMQKNEQEMNDWYDESINGAVAAVGGTIQSTKEIELDGLKGKEARVSIFDDSYTIVYRVFSAGGYLYLVAVIAPDGVEDRQDIRLFLNSFKVK